jgi:hypothetical protein
MYFGTCCSCGVRRVISLESSTNARTYTLSLILFTPAFARMVFF